MHGLAGNVSSIACLARVSSWQVTQEQEATDLPTLGLTICCCDKTHSLNCIRMWVSSKVRGHKERCFTGISGHFIGTVYCVVRGEEEGEKMEVERWI